LPADFERLHFGSFCSPARLGESMMKQFLLILCLLPFLLSCDQDSDKIYGEECPPEGEEMQSGYKWVEELRKCEKRHKCVEQEDGYYRCEIGTLCGLGQIKCGSKCVDPLSNRDFCGAKGDCDASSEENSTGNRCLEKEICAAGVCVAECQQGLAYCNGECINPLTSLKYCGATGTSKSCGSYTECSNNKICRQGQCHCEDGLILCNERCIDPLTDLDFCGAKNCATNEKGSVCSAVSQECVAGECKDISCEAGESICNDSSGSATCINIQSSHILHCGACNKDCTYNIPNNSTASACNNGTCHYLCKDNYENCGNESTPYCISKSSMDSDPSHCGACNTVCAATETCVSGTCTSSEDCDSAALCSSNSCKNDDSHCGASCKNCKTAQNAVNGYCKNDGNCQILRCKTGFHFNSDKTRCVPNSAYECAAPDSQQVRNCFENKETGVNEVTCNSKGECVPLNCSRGYALNVQETMCFMRGSNCHDIVGLKRASATEGGRCIISECVEGYHIKRGVSLPHQSTNDICVENSATACAPGNSDKAIDCITDAGEHAACNNEGLCYVVACPEQAQCSNSTLREAASCNEAGICADYRCANGLQYCAAKNLCLRLDGIALQDCESCPESCTDGQRCFKDGDETLCR
jgi:hypothetical protein